MESVHADTKVNGAPTSHLSKLIEAVNEIKNRPETRRQRAKEIAGNVAKAAKELDKAVEKCGVFFEEILNTELSDDEVNEKLTESGYPEPKDHELAIPNSINEGNLTRFDKATNVIVTALPSELREEAMFVMSLCSSLIFERNLVDNQLLQSREARRKAVAEILKIQLMQARSKSSSITNFRRQW